MIFLSLAGGEPEAKQTSAVKELSIVPEKVQFQRLLSVDSFYTKSLPNELLTGLHYFCKPVSSVEAAKKGGRSKEAYTWGQVS